MAWQKNANSYRREVSARLKKLAQFGPMVDGSLVVVRRRCGRASCRCAGSDEYKHPAYYLTRKVGKKTEGVYIPADLLEDVRAWNQEHRRLKELVSEICERQRELVRCLCAQRRGRGRKRP